MDDREKGRRFVTQALDPKLNFQQNFLDQAASLGVDRLQAEVALNAGRIAKPAFQTMAKGMVDALIDAGTDFQNMPGAQYKHGIPTTREEFDFYYALNKQKGKDGHASVATSAKFLEKEGYIEAFAKNTSTSIVQTLGIMVDELASRGIDTHHFLEATSRKILGPATIDLTQLDSRLTSAEKAYIKKNVTEARFITDATLLQSTEKDAPASSSWGERLRQETHDTAMNALSGIMKR